MTIRAYIPFTVSELAAQWPHPTVSTAFAPDAAARALRGDDLEEAEWLAMSAAAAQAGQRAVEGHSPAELRAVLAVDVDPAHEEPIAPGISLVTIDAGDLDIASVHADEPAVAARLSGEAAHDERVYDEASLLWYAPAEVSGLLDTLAQ